MTKSVSGATFDACAKFNFSYGCIAFELSEKKHDHRHEYKLHVVQQPIREPVQLEALTPL